LQDEDMLV